MKMPNFIVCSRNFILRSLPGAYAADLGGLPSYRFFSYGRALGRPASEVYSGLRAAAIGFRRRAWHPADKILDHPRGRFGGVVMKIMAGLGYFLPA